MKRRGSWVERLGAGAKWLVLAGSLVGTFGLVSLQAADFSRYRGFRFGGDLTSSAAIAGALPEEAKVLYRAPVLLQELEWQVRPMLLTNSPQPDPVTGATLCFADGKLFRMVVKYDHYRLRGMTVDDMVAAISSTYGVASRPTAEISLQSLYAETAKVLARWQDEAYAYDLVRTGDRSSFQLVLYSKQGDAKAQTAIAEARRLEILDAPRKARADEKLRYDGEQVLLEKQRTVNKQNFRP